MSHFTPINLDNIPGDLDLWLRQQRDAGNSERIILDALVYSMPKVEEAIREYACESPANEDFFEMYDDGFKDGKKVERERLRSRIQNLPRRSNPSITRARLRRVERSLR